MPRLLTRALVACLIAVVAAPGLTRAAPPPDEGNQGETTQGRLIPIPAGCPEPAEADVAFVGVVLDKDGDLARGAVRYRIDQLRAGSAAEFATNGIIDVRYGPDSKYLEIGETYLVSAAVDRDLGRLASTVAPAAPLFGGNDVIGLDDTSVECPELEDPIVTLHVDGTSVESGVINPLWQDPKVLLATIGIPAAIAGLVLIALVLLRMLWRWAFVGVFALGRAAVTPIPDQRAVRVRKHKSSTG